MTRITGNVIEIADALLRYEYTEFLDPRTEKWCPVASFGPEGCACLFYTLDTDECWIEDDLSRELDGTERCRKWKVRRCTNQ